MTYLFLQQSKAKTGSSFTSRTSYVRFDSKIKSEDVFRTHIVHGPAESRLERVEAKRTFAQEKEAEVSWAERANIIGPRSAATHV